MQDKRPYHDDIAKLLRIRKQYASGEQRVTLVNTRSSPEPGGDTVASARLGTDRKTGVAVIAGNFPGVNATVKVNMGMTHAGQQFRDAMGHDTNVYKTDANGVLTVPVKGYNSVQIDGCLAVFVPVKQAPGSQALSSSGPSRCGRARTAGREDQATKEIAGQAA